MNTATPDAVRMRGVSKHFGGVRALEGVDLDIRPGEVHALLGENGAGKSTILKILRGVQSPSAGSVEIGGVAMTTFTAETARRLGVAMAFQEMSLVPTLTVAQNVFLNREIRSGGFIDDRAAAEEARRLFARMGVAVDPLAKAADIPAGHRQLTEIVKATSQPCKVLVLDEPTTALSGNEVERLFDYVRQLKSEGVAVVYVSHRMDEIFRIATHATVLRDGRHVVTGRMADFTLDSLIAHIIGRRSRGFSDVVREPAVIGEALLEARGLVGAEKPSGVDLTLRRGEVVGIAGLLGSGRSSLARILAGIAPLQAGEIRVKGRAVAIAKPADAIAAGIALVPEDRARQGFVAFHSVESNIALPNLGALSRGGFVDRAKAAGLADASIGRLRIKTDGRRAPVRSLSGGNAQKVVIAKWLATEPDILILDEPTAGIDIGSKSEIVTLIRQLAKAGKAILVLSSELQELLAACDRILVMSDGRIVRDVERAALDPGDGRAEAEALGHAEQTLNTLMQQARTETPTTRAR
ncbi:ribose ABC transporter ATP-binding protein [Aureimonas endophytica]|uniref:Ribose ABC transporter ATP-binding protein n=1 Tax=Aureimonas endophytica TaxID=2027858 RepID=A0A917E5V9_9HYPH|nr:sugar ABC transporter ATP-binding protein [Aureimonas endophytica]GGE03672.1 ribose ABC transporter ATP-binding protein [Aureimonas endophytica]